jgi:hypothetical protein
MDYEFNQNRSIRRKMYGEHSVNRDIRTKKTPKPYVIAICNIIVEYSVALGHNYRALYKNYLHHSHNN